MRLDISGFRCATSPPMSAQTTWADLAWHLTTPQTAPSKAEAPCWSPATFDPSVISRTTGQPARSAKAARQLACAVFDLDDVPWPTLATIVETLTARGLAACLHSTWSVPAPGTARGRVVVPFEVPAPAEGWRGVRRAVAASLGLAEDADPSCSDPSRLYLGPYSPNLATAWATILDGRPLDWRTLPAPPRRAPQRDLVSVPLSREAAEKTAAKWRRKMHPCSALLTAVLEGAEFVPPGSGQRDDAMWRVLRALAEEHPAATEESINELFAPSLTHWKGDTGNETAGTKWLRALEHVAEAEEPDADSISVDLGELTTDQPWIVQRGRTFWLRARDGWARYTADDVAGAIERDLAAPRAAGIVETWTSNQRGERRPKTAGELVREYGAVARHHRITYTDPTRYDAATCTFRELAAARRLIAPAFDGAVCAWLVALFGERWPEGHAWLKYLCTLDRPCSMLVLAGAPNAGKSLLIAACAEFWSSPATDLETALASFNDSTGSPLVVGDETIPRDYRGRHKTADLRRLIQERQRTIRRKFMADATLFGAYRVILAANSDRITALDDALEENDIRAIAERFLHVPVAEAARAAVLPVVADRDAAIGRVAGHIAWIQETYEWSPRGRFLTHDGADQTLVRSLASLAGHRSAMLRWLWGYATGPRPYSSDLVQMARGGILVRAEAFEQHWDMIVKGEAVPRTAQLGRVLGEIGQPQRIGGRRWHWIDREHIVAWALATGFADAGEVRERIP